MVDWAQECDVLVVGSGAGGCCGAYTAAREGLSVILVEASKHRSIEASKHRSIEASKPTTTSSSRCCLGPTTSARRPRRVRPADTSARPRSESVTTSNSTSPSADLWAANVPENDCAAPSSVEGHSSAAFSSHCAGTRACCSPTSPHATWLHGPDPSSGRRVSPGSPSASGGSVSGGPAISGTSS